MRWHAELTKTSKVQPKVSLTNPPNTAFEPEVKIDLAVGCVWLSTTEAQWLAADITATLQALEALVSGKPQVCPICKQTESDLGFIIHWPHPKGA